MQAALTQHVGGTEWQLAAPRSGAFTRVCSDVEHVVGGRLKSVDDDECVGGVGGPVVGRVASRVVQQFVEHYLTVTMSLDWWIPLQSNAGRTGAARSEVVWRTGRNCKCHM